MSNLLPHHDVFKNVIAPIMARYGRNNLTFEICVYEPHRKYEKPKQVLHRIAAVDFEQSVNFLNSTCHQNYEIALSSRVFFGSEIDHAMHIPMIDTKGPHKTGLSSIESYLMHQIPDLRHLVWFKSGRSFHAYGTHLIDSSLWYVFMAKLVMLCARETSSLQPDQKWLAHRQSDSFACLRLTNRTNKFRHLPELVVLTKQKQLVAI
jgi:hypothetical protein